MKSFEIGHVTIEIGEKERSIGTIPSCVACKASLPEGHHCICLRPDAIVATKPKYPMYFCRSCWLGVLEIFV